MTPLHCAAFGVQHQKDMAELLLANKAKVNAKDSQGRTPLHYAAIGSHKDVVELLLTNKAAINARDRNGKTPLYYATLKGTTPVAELLRQHGGRK